MKIETPTLWHIALTIALISFRKNPRNGGHCGPAVIHVDEIPAITLSSAASDVV